RDVEQPLSKSQHWEGEQGREMRPDERKPGGFRSGIKRGRTGGRVHPGRDPHAQEPPGVTWSSH
ncbi:MAG TPA: hypothetical protein VJP81_09215, partial [Candidatus Dormibacteraeota bacterium]|nr:hypothetical protein [Candidatus Dormibacteraeota bacterium]